MAYTKPSGVNSLWAASGDKTTVPPAKVSAGWVAEKPSFQYFNQILYNLGLYDAYNNERGIPEWDNATEYQTTKSYVVGSDGNVYKCLITNDNIDPTTDDGTNWLQVWNNQGVVKWNLSTAYTESSVVRYTDGESYVCHTSQAAGTLPTDNSAFINLKYFGSYAYAVSQLANGDASKVEFIYIGQTVDTFDYLIYPEDGRVYARGTVTGTFAGDFNPSTGVDSGLTGALVQIDQIKNSQLLTKTDSMKVMFDLTGSVLTLNQDVVIKGVRLLSGATVTLPTLVNASDYKVLLLSDGSLSAQLYDVTNPAGSVTVGGFHVYHTTGGINPNSLWDENWRPSAKSPRSMALSKDQRVWADIYFMDVDYALNNYSRPDVTIADGDSPPIVPEIYGGDGVSTYWSLTWFEALDLVINAGKRLVFWGEFSGLAYGVVEQQSVGADPVTTKYQAGHRSAIGLEQATGVMWVWGADTQGSTGSAAAITDGRGSVYSADPRAVILGADWSTGVNAGSRSAGWHNSPGGSGSIGVRAVCDHLIL